MAAPIETCIKNFIEDSESSAAKILAKGVNMREMK